MATTTTVRADTRADRVVSHACEVADNPWKRLRGLMGRRELESGAALLLRPAGSVHTCFMRFPIDVLFLDSDMTVVGVAAGLRPWRAAGRRGARIVLELAAGESERHGIRVGDRLEIGQGHSEEGEQHVV